MQERIIDVTGANNSTASNSSGSANELMVFNFSESQTEIRSLIVKETPWLIAKDICNILELSDTNMALKSLDDDEKLTQKIFGSGQTRKMWLVNESGMYALIMRSNKPQAKTFRKWVTSEVLPAIRKTGSYSYRGKLYSNYLDARDIPYARKSLNDKPVKCIELEGVMWYNVTDLNEALGSSTRGSYNVVNLNKKQTLAQKIWIYGNASPSWFTNDLGFQLILSSCRTQKVSGQLTMPLLEKGGQSC